MMQTLIQLNKDKFVVNNCSNDTTNVVQTCPLKKIFLLNLFLINILLYPLSAHSYTEPKASEIARAEASTAYPTDKETIFYNPSAALYYFKDCLKYKKEELIGIHNLEESSIEKIRDHLQCEKDNIEFFVQSDFNAGTKSVFTQFSKLNTKNTVSNLDQLEGLVSKKLYTRFSLGNTTIFNKYFSFALINNLNYTSTIRGESNPILYLKMDLQLLSHLSFTFPIHDNLWFGVSLVPLYLLTHVLHNDAIAIYADSNILNPIKKGKEGLSIGSNLSFAYRKPLSLNHQVSIGGMIKNPFGSDFIKVGMLTSGKNGPPAALLPEASTGITYEYLWVGGIKFQTMYSYNYKEESHSQSSPHRLGLSILFSDMLTLSAGQYKDYPSFGADLNLLFMRFQFASYLEQNDMGDLSERERHYILQAGFSF